MTASRPWAGPEPPRLGRQGRRRVLVTMLMAGLLAGGAWLAIAQAASYPRVLHAVERADAWWLVLALAGAALGYVGYALLYQVFSRVGGGPRPGLRTALRLAVAVFGASVIATSAGRLGSEYWSMRRMGERPADAWSRVLSLNTAAWALLAALCCLGALALILGVGGVTPLGVELAWLLALPVCSLPALYLSSPARRQPADVQGDRIRTLAACVVRALALVRMSARRSTSLGPGLVGGLLYWGGELLIAWAGLRAFGVGVGLAPLLIGYATGFASTMLPLPAGGAGGVDAATTYSWTLVGVPLGPALLATLIQRLFSYWLPIVAAVLSLRSIRRLGHDLPLVSRAEQTELQPARSS